MNSTETITALHRTAARLRYLGFTASRTGSTVYVILGGTGHYAHVRVGDNNYRAEIHTPGQPLPLLASGLSLPGLEWLLNENR